MVELRGVTFTYAGGNRPAIRDVDLRVERGEFVLLTGPSGCGKSTLCRLLNGLIPHFYPGELEGEVRVAGHDVRGTPTHVLARHVGMVFQNPENQLFLSTVERELAFGLENLGYPREVMERRVREALIDQGYVPPPAVASMPTKLSEFGLALGDRERKGAWLPPDHKPRKGVPLFFSSCMSSLAPESVTAAFHLLKTFMDVDTIGREELCCGAMLKMAGYKLLAKDALAELAEQLKEFSPTRIIVCLLYTSPSPRDRG